MKFNEEDYYVGVGAGLFISGLFIIITLALIFFILMIVILMIAITLFPKFILTLGLFIITSSLIYFLIALNMLWKLKREAIKTTHNKQK